MTGYIRVMIAGGAHTGAAGRHPSKRAKQKCCRATPRCRSCPARLVAEARARERAQGQWQLVQDLLAPARPPLPESVEQALLALSTARDEHLAKPAPIGIGFTSDEKGARRCPSDS